MARHTARAFPILGAMRTSLLLFSLLLSLPAPAEEDVARSQVRAAAEAMGGEARLRALTSLRIQGIGHWNLVEQSERPEPPWLTMYEQLDETRDLRRGRLRQRSEGRGALLDAWQSFTLILADDVVAGERGGKMGPAGAAQLQDMRERLLLAPERVLLTALGAAELRTEPDEVLQDAPHHVVSFHQGRARIRLFLHANTRLPTAVELTEAYPEDFFWSVWGDVRTRILFQAWSLEPGGLLYPHQWDRERNGQLVQSFTVTNVTLNAPLSEADFTLPDDVKKGFAARKATKLEELPLVRPGTPPVELAPGVVQFAGSWNVTLVKQEDGVVVIEGPISAGYSARVLDEAARRFPGAPVKAVVSTSDAWPHVGGLREYVARGIPLRVLDLNVPLINRLLAAPHTLTPDALAKAPRTPTLQPIGARTVLGTGKNRLELIPLRTETGERMMLVWLPEHRLLYTSDMVQPVPSGGFFHVVQVAEVLDAAAREKLRPVRAFGMHLGPTDWSALATAVEKARAPAPAP